MDQIKELLERLKVHRKKIEITADKSYLIKLNYTIRMLEEKRYINEEDLIDDLISLGFPDIAKQIRKGQYV